MTAIANSPDEAEGVQAHAVDSRRRDGIRTAEDLDSVIIQGLKARLHKSRAHARRALVGAALEHAGRTRQTRNAPPGRVRAGDGPLWTGPRGAFLRRRERDAPTRARRAGGRYAADGLNAGLKPRHHIGWRVISFQIDDPPIGGVDEAAIFDVLQPSESPASPSAAVRATPPGATRRFGRASRRRARSVSAAAWGARLHERKTRRSD